MSSFDFVKPKGKFVDILERNRHEFDDGLSNSLLPEILFLKESGGDIEQGILWPREEPINNGAVHKSRELSCSSSE